jgi:hypothetical protein
MYLENVIILIFIKIGLLYGAGDHVAMQMVLIKLSSCLVHWVACCKVFTSFFQSF